MWTTNANSAILPSAFGGLPFWIQGKQVEPVPAGNELHGLRLYDVAAEFEATGGFTCYRDAKF